MGQSITILEFIIIAVVSVLGYVLVKTIFRKTQ